MSRIERTVAQAIAEIADLPGVTTRPGVSAGDLRMLEQRLEIHLPAAYEALLIRTNGLEVARGRKRIFGYGPGAPIDIAWWNDPDTWKWAYRWLRDDLDDYVVFGTTAEHTFTVCRRSDLQEPDSDPEVTALQPSVKGTLGPGIRFSGWIERGIRYQAQNPVRDDEDRQLFARFPEIPPDRLLVDPPLLWATGEDDLDQMVLMPADQAMIANADMQRSGQELREGDAVLGVDTYEDEHGRTRLAYRTQHTSG